MSRKLLALAGVVLVFGGLTYISWPVGHIPPYDANLVRLAESDLQGYCSGRAYWMSQGVGDASLAKSCRNGYASRKSDKPNMPAVQTAFCRALVDMGWSGKVGDCLGIMGSYQLWPTYGGGITDQWNRARPYPRPLVAGSGPKAGGSRTGGRDGNERSNNPTHEVPGF